MVTGLPFSLKSSPLNGMSLKSQVQDSETIQPLSFGEILKAKEKQLEQEINLSAALVALAAMQTSFVSMPMLDPIVKEEFYKADIQPALKKGLPVLLTPQRSSSRVHSQVTQKTQTNFNETQKDEMQVNASVPVSTSAPSAARPTEQPEIPVPEEAVLTQNPSIKPSVSSSDSFPNLNAGKPDGQNNSQSHVSNIVRTQNMPDEGFPVAARTVAKSEANVLPADTHLDQTAPSATRPAEPNVRTETTQREFPRRVGPQTLPERTAKLVEAKVIQSEIGESQVNTRPAVEFPSSSIPAATPEEQEVLPANLEAKQTKIVVETKTEDVNTTVSPNSFPQHSDNTVRNIELPTPEPFRTIPPAGPAETPAHSDLGKVPTALGPHEETVGGPSTGLPPEAVSSQVPADQKKAMPRVKTAEYQTGSLASQPTDNIIKETASFDGNGSTPPEVKASSPLSNSQSNSETSKVATHTGPSSDFVSIESNVEQGSMPVEANADTMTVHPMGGLKQSIHETSEINRLPVDEAVTSSQPSLVTASGSPYGRTAETQTVEEQNTSPAQETGTHSSQSVKTFVRAQTEIDQGEDTEETQKTGPRSDMAVGDEMHEREALPKNVEMFVSQKANEDVHVAHQADKAFPQTNFNVETPGMSSFPMSVEGLPIPSATSQEAVMAKADNAEVQIDSFAENTQSDAGESVVSNAPSEISSERGSNKTIKQTGDGSRFTRSEIEQENVTVETKVVWSANENMTGTEEVSQSSFFIGDTEANNSKSVMQSTLSAQEPDTLAHQSAEDSVTLQTEINQNDATVETKRPETQRNIVVETVAPKISTLGTDTDQEVDSVRRQPVFNTETPVAASVDYSSDKLSVAEGENDGKTTAEAAEAKKHVEVAENLHSADHIRETSPDSIDTSVSSPNTGHIFSSADKNSTPSQTANPEQSQIKAERHTHTAIADREALQSSTQNLEMSANSATAIDMDDPSNPTRIVDPLVRTNSSGSIHMDVVQSGLDLQDVDLGIKVVEQPASPAKPAAGEAGFTSSSMIDTQLRNKPKQSDSVHSERFTISSVPVELTDLRDLNATKSENTAGETQNSEPETDKSVSLGGSSRPQTERPSVANASSGADSTQGTGEVKAQTIVQPEETSTLLDEPEFDAGSVQKSIEQESAVSDLEVVRSQPKSSGPSNQVSPSNASTVGKKEEALSQPALRRAVHHSPSKAQRDQGLESQQTNSFEKELVVPQSTIPVAETSKDAEGMVALEGMSTAENEILRQSAIETKTSQAAPAQSKLDSQQDQSVESHKYVSFDGEVIKSQSFMQTAELPKSTPDGMVTSETNVAGENTKVAHHSAIQSGTPDVTELPSETAVHVTQTSVRHEHKKDESKTNPFEPTVEVTQAKLDASPSAVKSGLPRSAPYQTTVDFEKIIADSQSRIEKQVNEVGTEAPQVAHNNAVSPSSKGGHTEIISPRTPVVAPSTLPVVTNPAPLQTKAVQQKPSAATETVEKPVNANEKAMDGWQRNSNVKDTAKAASLFGNESQLEGGSPQAVSSAKPSAVNSDMDLSAMEVAPLQVDGHDAQKERSSIGSQNVETDASSQSRVVTFSYSGNDNGTEGVIPRTTFQEVASSVTISSDSPTIAPLQSEVHAEKPAVEPQHIKKQVHVNELFAGASEPADHPTTSSSREIEAEPESVQTQAAVQATPSAAANPDIPEAAPAQIETDQERWIIGTEAAENQVSTKDQESLVVNTKNVEKPIGASEFTVDVSYLDSDIPAKVAFSQTVIDGESDSIRLQAVAGTIHPDDLDVQQAGSFKAEIDTEKQVVDKRVVDLQGTEKQIDANASTKASNIRTDSSEAFTDDDEAQPIRIQTPTQATSSVSTNVDGSEASSFTVETELQKPVLQEVEKQANTTTTVSSPMNGKQVEKITTATATGSNLETNPQHVISEISISAREFTDVQTVEPKEPQNREVSVQASIAGNKELHVAYKSEAFTKEDLGQQELRADQTHLTDEKTRTVEKEYEPNKLLDPASVATNSQKENIMMGPAEKDSAIPVDLHAIDVVQQVIRQLNGRLKSGLTSMQLHLNPEALGAIEVEMVRDAQGVSVTFVAEQSSTGKLLESQLGQLRQSLVDSGVQLSGLNIGQHNHTRQEGGFQHQDTNFAQHSPHEAVHREVDAKQSPRVERIVGQTSEVDYLI